MFRSIIFTAAALSFLTGAAMAGPYDVPGGASSGSGNSRGYETFDAVTGAAKRLEVSCELYVHNRPVYKGLCNVGRRGRVSSIETRNATFKIVRDEATNERADFYRNDDFIDEVYAEGGCWVGAKVRYCAR
jgi:hypothetical protein